MFYDFHIPPTHCDGKPKCKSNGIIVYRELYLKQSTPKILVKF